METQKFTEACWRHRGTLRDPDMSRGAMETLVDPKGDTEALAGDEEEGSEEGFARHRNYGARIR